jgi:hypothetical protein
LDNKQIAKLIPKFFSWYSNNFVVQEVPDGLLTKNGLASMPTAWRTAITETFLSNSSGLNLNIGQGGKGTCSGIKGG